MTAETIDITLALPRQLVHRLECTARAQHATLADVVVGALDHVLPAAADLPPALLAELMAMVDLSDAGLREVAMARLSERDDARLQALDRIARARPLNGDAAAEHEALLWRWQEAVIRRSHALQLLQRRGYALAEAAGSHPLA